MKLALQQAQRVLGKTKTNPAVGCIIVKENKVISAGFTSVGGRPHAEYNAINSSKFNIKKAITVAFKCGGASSCTVENVGPYIAPNCIEPIAIDIQKIILSGITNLPAILIGKRKIINQNRNIGLPSLYLFVNGYLCKF